MSPPVVTFLSDFGHDDWFVGVVHGVVAEVAPATRVIDLSHSITAGDVARAAFILEAAAPDFAAGTVHIVVVDPGVGTERRALGVKAWDQYFVGPDNGVLEWALADPSAEVRVLENVALFREPVSRTFHGRDVFAPVAAHLASGVTFATVGAMVKDPVRLSRPQPVHEGGALLGQVVFVDHFGNCVTNLTTTAIAAAFGKAAEASLVVRVHDRRIAGITRSYGDAPIGTLVAILGSSGRLELAEVGGAASSRWGIGPGDRVGIQARES